MCYSYEASIKTSLISFLAIIYLLSSGIQKFMHLGYILIGWCGMQFAEALLWKTEPYSGCTLANQMITLVIIPLVLMAQPLGSIWGATCSKDIKIKYSVFVVATLLIYNFGILPLLYPFKSCTVVTPQGHLDWNTVETPKYSTGFNLRALLMTVIWGAIILYPFFKYWTGKNAWLIPLIPTIGAFYSVFTDSPGSIWCYYTSYGSYVAAGALLLHQLGMDIV
jgi:hypothetical protein